MNVGTPKKELLFPFSSYKKIPLSQTHSPEQRASLFPLTSTRRSLTQTHICAHTHLCTLPHPGSPPGRRASPRGRAGRGRGLRGGGGRGRRGGGGGGGGGRRGAQAAAGEGRRARAAEGGAEEQVGGGEGGRGLGERGGAGHEEVRARGARWIRRMTTLLLGHIYGTSNSPGGAGPAIYMRHLLRTFRDMRHGHRYRWH